MTDCPYIVTRRRAFTRQLVGCYSTSRRACVTLEEADKLVVAMGGCLQGEETHDADGRLMDAHWTQPDGSTIEVERVTWGHLVADIGEGGYRYRGPEQHAEIIDAWNAKHGGES